jgi:enoyl-CoA hydratase
MRRQDASLNQATGWKDAMTEEARIKCRRQGAIGRIILNRPAALNALDLAMIQSMQAALERWQDDPEVAAVILEGAGDRAFCAGGDIALVHRSARTDPEIARTLWREEYRLDARIARYPKPIVAFMDGITMGGGLGISGHATVRIATERTVLAMPEVAIGLAPDVGGALLLSRAPGEVGTHLALTAKRIGADDAVYCGLADHVVKSSRLPSLLEDLSANGAIHTIADTYGRLPGTAELPPERPWIDACYGGDDTTLEEVLSSLRARSEAGARKAAETIAALAPTALKVTLHALRAARSMTTIEECLRQDYRLCTRFLAHPDLREGIRAAILDKDRSPHWDPPTLPEVEPESVARFFAPLNDELVLP